MKLQAASITGIDFVSSSAHTGEIGERLKTITTQTDVPERRHTTRIPGFDGVPFDWGEAPEHPFKSLIPTLFCTEYDHFPEIVALTATVADVDTTVDDFFLKEGHDAARELKRSFSEWWDEHLNTRSYSQIAPAIYDGIGLFPPTVIAVSIVREEVFEAYYNPIKGTDPPVEPPLPPEKQAEYAENQLKRIIQGEMLQKLGIALNNQDYSLITRHTNRALALVEASYPSRPYTSLIIVEVTENAWPDSAFHSPAGPNLAVSYDSPPIWDIILGSLFCYHWSRKHQLAVQSRQEELREETRKLAIDKDTDSLKERITRIGKLSGTFYQDYTEFVSYKRRIVQWPKRVGAFVSRTAPGDKYVGPQTTQGNQELEGEEGVLQSLTTRLQDTIAVTENQYNSICSAIDNTAGDVQRKINYRLNETNVKLHRIGVILAGLLLLVAILQLADGSGLGQKLLSLLEVSF